MNNTKTKRFVSFFKKNYVGWIFASPIILGLIIFMLWPMIQSLIFSFYKYDGINEFEFIGWGNYERIFGFDLDIMGTIVSNTLIYTVVSVPLNLILSFMIALLLNQKLKGIYGYRLWFYLPCMVPTVASTILWRDMFDPIFGVMNEILGAFGLPSSNFIYGAESAMVTVICMNFFTLGGGMILWLSALKNVPVTLYESADLDGARWYHKLFKITIPMCTPMIFYNLITSIIGTLQVFHLYMLNGVGPNNSLFFYAVKIYLEAFTEFRMGYACALAWMLFLVIAVLIMIVFKTSKWVYYGEDE